LPVLTVDGFEADDVVATCVRVLSGSEDVSEIIVASSDKDLCQLVRDADEDGRFPAVRVLSLQTNELRGPADVQQKFGVEPGKMGDWLALVGDVSDNVAGAPGIGEKKASALLAQYGSLTGIYSTIERLDQDAWQAQFNGSPTGKLIGGPAVYLAIKRSGQQVALARKLVALRDDVPVPTSEELLKQPVRVQDEDPPLDDQFAADPFASEKEEAIQEEAADPVPESGPQPVSAPAVAARETPKEPEPARETIVEQQVNPQTGEVTEVKTELHTEPAPAKTNGNGNGNGKAAAPTELGRLLQQPIQWEKALEPQDPGQAIKIAGRLFSSRMFAGYGNEDAVLGAILLGRELGLGAMGSLRGICNIEGKYGLYADLMVALVLRSGKAEYFEPVELTADHATYRTKRVGRDEFRMTFSIAEAEQAGVVKEKSGWKKWPLDMCDARCKARIARKIYSDVVFGLYTPEELKEDL
jgi:hypothetical protein